MIEDQDPAPATTEEALPQSNRSFYRKRHSKIGAVVKQVIHTWPSDEAMRRSGKKPYALQAPKTLDHLEFEPQPMVGWYRPSELIKAGIETVVSTLFGSYADKREVESVLTEEEWHDYSHHFEDHDDLWIDYIADLGDGFDSTYTMARMLAEPALSVTHKDAETGAEETQATERGRILVMGGDEVYPTAKREEYENRMIQPYRCAYPFGQYEEQAPHLYLIPGNHDWYDGLNSFFKSFCNHNWIGGWRTWQRRSYFALRLVAQDEATGRPALWLWGIDIQLGSNIDQPQLDYFKHIADEVMAEGSRILLCTAEPSWVYGDAKTKEARDKATKAARSNDPVKAEKYQMEWEKKKAEIYHNLGHLEKKAIKPHEHQVIVGLTGDWHNYTRYEAADSSGHQRFVSGGGGAYLYPTHNMPKRLKLAEKFGAAEYERKTIFPDEVASKKLANWSLLFSFFRLNLWFTGFLGAFYLLLAWIMQSVSAVRAGDTGALTLLEAFAASLDLKAHLRTFFDITSHSPETVVFLVVLVGGLMAFSGYESWGKKALHGGLHGLAHVALFIGLMYLFAQVNLNLLDLNVEHPVQIILFGTEMLVFGGFLGGVVFGFYLWVSNRFLAVHDNEVLLCQSDPDYKNFLRFHITKDGQITIYPIGVERVNRVRKWNTVRKKTLLNAWKLQPDAKGGKAWFEPIDGPIQKYACLIEEPIPVSFGADQAAPTAPQEADVAA